MGFEMQRTIGAWLTILFRCALVSIIVVLLAVLSWSIWSIFTADQDSATVMQHEEPVQETATPSAEDRASEAITRIIDRQQKAIEPAEHLKAEKSQVERKVSAAPAEPAIPDTTVKLNCSRLRQAYSAEELSGMKEFQKLCQ